ncbi:2Fe-2S iron-sulfur cluster-binding protein [Stappia sp.]|uniref:2Fe-2S iron-sulfur cluster-binding protein n=1 Tax=Stappia sp. TaxID=1870903 RepID=UPI003A99947D
MVRVTYISASGVETTVDGREGDSVMATAVANNIDGIVGECGGSMACATCHVYVDPAFADRLSPRSDDEEAMLEGAASDPRPESRLSCQIRLSADLDGLVLRMPEEQM